MMTKPSSRTPLLDKTLARSALRAAVRKLDPRTLLRNPVMFVTEVAAFLATLGFLRDLLSAHPDSAVVGQLAAWLWFTVLFANFAEAVAEGRGKARADALRAIQADTGAKRLGSAASHDYQTVPSSSLRKNDIVLVEQGDLIPADGEVIDGIASVNEAAVTGESAPVIRESGGDRSAVTGGTRVVSDWIVVRIEADPGQGFVDRMIALVEGAQRQKTPNEVALNILLIGMTLVFLMVVVTLEPFALHAHATLPVIFLIALLVTLIPTTIGGLLSAIGIAGMDRLVQANVIAKSGRAVEAAGNVDTLLIDKTGTITFGNRRATEMIPVGGANLHALAEAALYSSLADETAEGRSIVTLVEHERMARAERHRVTAFIEFSAATRLSGADLSDGSRIRKGAVDSVLREVGSQATPELSRAVETIAHNGATPLAVARDGQILGLIALSDIVKPGIRERFEQLRAMGIRTIMITGDNPLTAATIAAQAGVDDYLAEATPEKKLEWIRREQAEGRMVAMCGDGTNDAPALAQADIGVAMNDGTPAAREAANLVDLDSDPTKLMAVVQIGKQLLISRGSLTTFSIANDVAKYFAILPALFASTYPSLQALNLMHLRSPQSAILSAVIFNALIIIALIPLALRGVNFRANSADALLRHNLLVYGVGGLLVPFAGIKLIDLALSAAHLA